MRARLNASVEQRADALEVRTTAKNSGGGICRTTSFVSASSTVITVRPLSSSTWKRRLRCVSLESSLKRAPLVRRPRGDLRLRGRQFLPATEHCRQLPPLPPAAMLFEPTAPASLLVPR